MTQLKPRLTPLWTMPVWRGPKLPIAGKDNPRARPMPVDSGSSGLAWARRYRFRLRITDVGVILAAVTIALLARFGSESASASIGALRTDYWVFSAMIACAWIATLGAFHTRDSRVVGMGATEYKQVVNASALAFGMLAIGFVIFQVDIARSYFIFALPLGVAGLVLDRWLWRKWLLRQCRFGHYLARAIVVGARDDVEYVVGQIHEKSGAAYCVTGVAIDGDDTSIIAAGRRVPVVSNLANVAQAASATGVETVIVAGQPSGGSKYIRHLGWELENSDADLVLSSRLTDIAGPRIHFRPVEGLPLIHVEIPRFSGAKHAMKRILDIGVSAAALVILSPLLVAIAALIRWDSPGGLLFRQERCGRNMQTFQMLKFRSMVHTAEDDLAGLLSQNEGSGVLFKIRHDPRITRVGAVLRKYSLDELPQLWNILVGDMSLVGPRPPLPAEVEAYERDVHRRLYIKPGLTGMWQVNGRSDLSWDESVRLDLYYVENWSIMGDLFIIWRTFRTVTRAVGAY
jgi:exopolysaccharide biosynthesis polyprenyl glycosylphosphotransferase